MDRNELVEKAARAIAGRNRYEDQSRNYILQARRAIDAILPDVIEAIREEAAQIAGGLYFGGGRVGSATTWGAKQAAVAIRAAVLGDALKGGK